MTAMIHEMICTAAWEAYLRALGVDPDGTMADLLESRVITVIDQATARLAWAAFEALSDYSRMPR